MLLFIVIKHDNMRINTAVVVTHSLSTHYTLHHSCRTHPIHLHLNM